MKNIELEKLRFPIGKFEKPDIIDNKKINEWIGDIDKFPEELADLTINLSKEKLNWKYRPNGWTIKQVIHHCADSHLNSLVRFKLALTETNPTIKPYFEDRWAELPDSHIDNVEDSLMLLASLHRKWTFLLRNLTDAECEKSFFHPENNQSISLKENIGIYAWHSNHHLEHVKQALFYSGQFNDI